MAFERYARGLIPAAPESVPDFTNTELLKVERTIDSLYSSTTDALDAVEAEITALDGDLTALTASSIANVPAGTLAATDVQAALNELDTEKASLAGAIFYGSITIPSPLAVGSSQVLTSRRTGWSADTGTAKRTANATYSGVADAAYTQATIQALMDAVRDLSQVVKAIKDDLIAHGIIGT